VPVPDYALVPELAVEAILPFGLSPSLTNWYRHYPSQPQLASDAAKRLINEELPDTVGLHVKNGYGKTMTAGMIATVLNHEFQRKAKTRGKSLFIYCSLAEHETSHSTGLGCYESTTFVPSKDAKKRLLNSQLVEHNYAAIMMTYRGFHDLLNGNPSPLTGHCLADLDREDFQNGATVRSVLKGEKPPKLQSLVSEMGITNVVIVADEYQMFLNQPNGKLPRLLASQKKLSQTSIFGEPFNFYVIGLSATPGTVPARDDCSEDQFYINQTLFYSLNPFPHEKDVGTARLKQLANASKARASIDFDIEDDPQAAVAYGWCRGPNHGVGIDTMRRSETITDPVDSAILSEISTLVTMTALIPNGSGVRGWTQGVEGVWEVDDTNVVMAMNVERASKKIENDVKLILTPTRARTVYHDKLLDVNAASFLMGRVRGSLSRLNVHSPGKRWMRRVTAVNGFKPVWEWVKHYDFVFIVIDADHEPGLVHAKAAIASLNADPRSKTKAYDFTGLTKSAIDADIEKATIEFYKNEKQAVAFILAKWLPGSSLLSKVATSIVYLGQIGRNKLDIRMQCFGRLAREGLPLVDMIVPSPQSGGYEFHMAHSSFTSALEVNNKVENGMITLLPAGSIERRVFNELAAEDEKATTAYKQFLFRPGGNSRSSATSVQQLYPRLSVPGYSSLIAAFRHLFYERDGCTPAWETAFTRYLRLVKTTVNVSTSADGED
jgi:hypothetical protein